MKIGLVYVKGAVPGFENFGNLPTHLVKGNGLIEGKDAHQVLDGLIIPGGSIVESGSLTPELGHQIKLWPLRVNLFWVFVLDSRHWLKKLILVENHLFPLKKRDWVFWTFHFLL